MFGNHEVLVSALPLREQAVVKALQAHLRVDEFVARRPKRSKATVQRRIAVTTRVARLRSARAGLLDEAARHANRPERLQLLALRQMLQSENARELNLRWLMALRKWTGAGQAFLWAIGSGGGGLWLMGESGITYAVHQDGVIPFLAAQPIAVDGADSITSEQRAIVASLEAGSTFVADKIIALSVAHSGRRWLAWLSHFPDGRANDAAVEMALILAGMAATIAEAWAEPVMKRMAASAAAIRCVRRRA